jgi:uncharacterized protein DUF5996
MPDPSTERSTPSGAEHATSAASQGAGMSGVGRVEEAWPSLPYEEWKDTYETLHMWTQVVGKIRLALSPMVNHWWQVTLYVTPSGLTTSPIPYGARTFEILFDFIAHTLTVQTSDGATRCMGLYPRSVADFYHELMSILRSLGIEVRINPTPQEVPSPIPCDVDTVHASYDEGYVGRFRRILVQTDRVFKQFRGRFIGKCSPVHFFWGSFDLAVTRFSGRRAPERPGADRITREAYSHECSSAGFWPGSGGVLVPAYYAYTVPEPDGLSKARVRPNGAYYDPHMQEFLLPYDDVRNATDPEAALLDFLQTTYAAGADLARWDRPSLEWQGQ